MRHDEAVLYFADAVIKALNEKQVKPPAENIGSALMVVCFVIDHPEIKPEGASINHVDGKWVLHPQALESEPC